MNPYSINTQGCSDAKSVSFVQNDLAYLGKEHSQEGDEGWQYRPNGKLLCLWQTPQKYASRAWHYSIPVWLLGQSVCSSPSTKELHDPMHQSIFFLPQQSLRVRPVQKCLEEDLCRPEDQWMRNLGDHGSVKPVWPLSWRLPGDAWQSVTNSVTRLWSKK